MFIYKKLKISQLAIGLFHVVTLPCAEQLRKYLQMELSSAVTRQIT